MPPMRKDGFVPATSKIHESIDVVFVLPCVPATTTTSLPTKNSSCNNCGNEQNGMRWSSTCSSSTLPREIALPTTTRPGLGLRFSAENGCETGMLSDCKKSDIGGYAAASEPDTGKPRSDSMPARDAMAVPQMPMRWI